MERWKGEKVKPPPDPPDWSSSARQGMTIVVPSGDPDDHTRPPEFYDPIYAYLKEIGFLEIE